MGKVKNYRQTQHLSFQMWTSSSVSNGHMPSLQTSYTLTHLSLLEDVKLKIYSAL